MKTTLVYLAACLALASAAAHHGHDHGEHSAEPEIKDCPNLTEESLQKLKAIMSTEDVTEQLLGEHTQVWGPKEVLEKDPEGCFKTSRTKFDDKIINQTIYMKASWIKNGEKTKNGSLEKVENGVYIAKKGCGKSLGKVYVLYAKDNVVAYYMCKFDKKPETEEGKTFNSSGFPAVVVRSKDAKIPLDEATQKEVDEAVKKIQSEPELFGEIQKQNVIC